jgi:DNA-directed RNA polymerase subunit RPC12/RpoP
MALKCVRCGEKFFADTPIDIIKQHNEKCPYERRSIESEKHE